MECWGKPMFKVGDRVDVKGHGLGSVERVSGNSFGVPTYEVRLDSAVTRFFLESELVFVGGVCQSPIQSQFKSYSICKGDRIEVVSPFHKRAGQKGTVFGVHDRDLYKKHYAIEFDNGTMDIMKDIDVEPEKLPGFNGFNPFGGYTPPPPPTHITVEPSETYEQKMKSEGRCPKCGELGRYHIGQAICSKHGPY